MKRWLSRLCTVICAVMLAGCASKDPMDYLPECGVYVAVNGAEARNQPGTKKLMDLLHKMEPTSLPMDEKVGRLYMGMQPGARPTVYGVVTGTPGITDSVMSHMKSSGGVEIKVNGKKSVQQKGVVVTSISDTGLVFYSEPKDFDVMLNTAKKKNPSALTTPQFQKASELLNSHAVAITGNTGPLISMGETQINAIGMMNPKGAEALKQVKLASMTLDWPETPKVEASLHLSDEQQSKDLAGLLNFLLTQVKANPSRLGPFGGVMDKLAVNPGPTGVSVALEFPKSESDAFLTKLEKTVETLPADPAQRSEALRKAFSGQQ